MLLGRPGTHFWIICGDFEKLGLFLAFTGAVVALPLMGLVQVPAFSVIFGISLESLCFALFPCSLVFGA